MSIEQKLRGQRFPGRARRSMVWKSIEEKVRRKTLLKGRGNRIGKIIEKRITINE